MGMSFGNLDAHDPPYPDYMNDARHTVKSALDKAGVGFYSGWRDDNMSMEEAVDHLIDVIGVKMMGAPSKEFADYGRAKSGTDDAGVATDRQQNQKPVIRLVVG